MIEAGASVLLASASPRRKQLLELLGLAVEQISADIEERRADDEPVKRYVRRLALEKAATLSEAGMQRAVPVIAGDTVVAIGERSFEKPADEEDAVRMLTALSATTHEVHTSVCVSWRDTPVVAVVSTAVTFRKVSESEARRYWATGEPRGKAGAYAIQGLGAQFVAHLSGSHSAVMGLPIFETSELLGQLKDWP
ncbi:MAG: Maf family protein [Pseudomonadota bacterium]